MDNFTPSSSERKNAFALIKVIYLFVASSKLSLNFVNFPGNLISHIFRENDVFWDTEWERYFCYKNIEVPEVYTGPHLTFPLTVEQAVCLLEAFRNKKVGARSVDAFFCPKIKYRRVSWGTGWGTFPKFIKMRWCFWITEKIFFWKLFVKFYQEWK